MTASPSPPPLPPVLLALLKHEGAQLRAMVDGLVSLPVESLRLLVVHARWLSPSLVQWLIWNAPLSFHASSDNAFLLCVVPQEQATDLFVRLEEGGQQLEAVRAFLEPPAPGRLRGLVFLEEQCTQLDLTPSLLPLASATVATCPPQDLFCREAVALGMS